MSNSRFLTNAIANFASRVASAMLNVMAVPVYIRFLGTEAFGLMAFVLALQSVLSILDLGLAGTVNREVARVSTGEERGHLVYTLSSVYWVMTFGVLALLAAAAWPIALFWLNLKELSASSAAIAVALAGAGIALRWPSAFYSGVLQGLERQVAANVVILIGAVIRVAGSIIVVVWIAPSLAMVLSWHIIASGIEVALLRRLAWQNLHELGARDASFTRSIMCRVWRFAVGFSAVGVAGTLLSNIDRLLMARFLSLGDLGMYATAASIAGLLTVVGSAVSTAAFPRFARASLPGLDREQNMFHEISGAMRLIVWAILPGSLSVILFGFPLLEIWTGRGDLVQSAGPVLIMLACAAALNALANPFYTLLVADGQTRWLFGINSISLAILLPFYFVMLPRWGVRAGAAGALLQGILLLCSCLWRCRTLMYRKRSAVKRIMTCFCIGVVFSLAAATAAQFSAASVQLIIGAGVCLLCLLITSGELRELGRVIRQK